MMMMMMTLMCCRCGFLGPLHVGGHHKPKARGEDALVCRNPTPISRLGSRVVLTVPPLEG
jgi:hypothetical protein